MRPVTATDVEAAQPVLADATGVAWPARRTLASTIRVVALGAPVLLSVAAVYGTSQVAGTPPASPALMVGWWVVLSGVATASLVVAGRLVRRLLPLAALLRLSLVFPDHAPSRFRMALRTGTVDTLEDRLADARNGAASRTPVQSARLLLEMVAHLDEHDPLTRGHSERVRAYAQSIGRELGLDRHDLDLLNWAALLHDVGKLDIPHEILAKAGRPTEREWEVLRTHPEAGAQLAAPLRGWLGEWSAAIEQHHERWDGTGYPHGLGGEDISLAGRIVAVADVFDVITSTRSYKRPASVIDARRELLRCAGTQFDPDVVRAFLAISVHQSRLAAPIAWLAQAALLARLPVTQAASGLSVGAAAVAVGVGAGVGTPLHVAPEAGQPARAIHDAEPGSSGLRHAVAVSPRAPERRTGKPKPIPRATRAAPPAARGLTPGPSSGKAAQVPKAPEPPSTPTPSPPHAADDGSGSARTHRGPVEHDTSPADGADTSAPLPVAAPSPVDVVISTVDNVTQGVVAPAADDVTQGVVAPAAGDLASVVDQVAPQPLSPTPPSTTQTPPASSSPPPDTSPSSPPPGGDGAEGLLEGVLSLVTGLLSPGA